MAITLLPASVLVLFGIVLFVIGNLTDYTAVAVIGGILVVGVGAVITTEGGLVHQAGSQETIVNETENRTVVSHEPQYEPVETPVNLDLGFIIMLVGSLLSLQPLGEVD